MARCTAATRSAHWRSAAWHRPTRTACAAGRSPMSRRWSAPISGRPEYSRLMARQAALRAVVLAALALVLLAAPAAAQTVGSTKTTAAPTTPTDPNAAVPVPHMSKGPTRPRPPGVEGQKIAQRKPGHPQEHA